MACGRRFGKTELGKVLAYREIAKNAGEVWWITPQYKMSTTVWRELLETFRPITSWISAQERTLITKNGGKLVVWAGDTSGDSMRGGAPNLAILDEAAMIKDNELWFKVIMPALTTHEGRAYFLSTPRGRNWFYELYEKGNPESHTYHPDYKSWRFNSYQNPHQNPKMFDDAKESTPHKFFMQEYMAEFLTDSGDVFRGAAEVSTLPYRVPYVGGRFIFGIDWGRKNDFTVITVMDAITKEQVDAEWLNKIDYPEQLDFIQKMIRKWNPVEIVIEENAIGLPLIEFLERDGVKNIESVYFTNKRKREYIEQLQLDIEKQNIKLLNEPRQVRELQAYEMDRTSFGNIQYNAADGFHDDMVIALALCNYHVQNQFMSFGASMPKIRGWD